MLSTTLSVALTETRERKIKKKGKSLHKSSKKKPEGNWKQFPRKREEGWLLPPINHGLLEKTMSDDDNGALRKERAVAERPRLSFSADGALNYYTHLLKPPPPLTVFGLIFN